MGGPGGQGLSRSQECALAAVKASGTQGCVNRSMENGLLGSGWDVVIPLYLALVCLRVEHVARFGGLW